MSLSTVLAALLTATLPVASEESRTPSLQPTTEATGLVPLSTPPMPAAPMPVEPVTAEPSAHAGTPVTEEAAPEANDPATAESDPVPIVVTGRPPSDGDPLEKVNAQSFEVTQQVDAAVVRPVAMAYKSGLPEPVRDGLANFFLNLHEPVVAVNYLLQLKPGKAIETAGRFLLNSTLGVAGLFDVARKKPFRLPRRPNGLADTLGFYGVKPGPFFYLPLIGPTTLRDSFGNLIDGFFLPTVVGKPFTGLTYTVPATVIRSLNRRLAVDERMARANAAADPYRETRDSYLRQRQEEIDQLHSRRPAVPVLDLSGVTFAPAPVPVPVPGTVGP